MRYHAVLGLDPSLTSFGMASIDLDEGAISTRALKTKEVGERRVEYLIETVRLAAQTHDIVGIEGPSFGSKKDRYWHETAGLWRGVRHMLWQEGVPIVQVAPKVRAKYSTGNGNSAKPAVAEQIRFYYPHLRLKTMDECDALLVGLVTARVIGQPIDGYIDANRYKAVNGMVIERG